MKSNSKFNKRNLFQIGGLTFIFSPLVVFLHELFHILALTAVGVPAALVGFGMAMPVGFFWDFEGLSQAQIHYGVGSSAFVIGALAGPLFTLMVGIGGLAAYRRWHHPVPWALGFSAIALRMFGILMNMPKVINGSINTMDEAIAAFFLGWPVGSIYWPSLLIGLVILGMLVRALKVDERLVFFLLGFVGSVVGYVVVETLVNSLFFNLETWVR